MVDKGTVVEKRFNSCKILLEDGRTILASGNHVKLLKGK